MRERKKRGRDEKKRERGEKKRERIKAGEAREGNRKKKEWVIG